MVEGVERSARAGLPPAGAPGAEAERQAQQGQHDPAAEALGLVADLPVNAAVAAVQDLGATDAVGAFLCGLFCWC